MRRARIGDEVVICDRITGIPENLYYTVTGIDPVRVHQQQIYEEYGITDTILNDRITWRLSERQEREDRINEILN